MRSSIEPLHCSSSELRRAARRLSQLYDGLLEPSAIRATQHNLLTQVDALHAPTMKALAARLAIDLSALGHTLKPLERDGYVALVRDDRDRRAKRVTLTHTGATKLEETTRLWRMAQERFTAAYGPRKAAKLRKALTLLASDDFSQAFATATRVKRPA